MKTEKSCGAIVTRQNKQGITEVLLARQQNGLTGFPKGHSEPGETEIETAKRELLEETGLHVLPDISSRFSFDYIIPAGTIRSSRGVVEEPIHKIVVLFLATLDSPNSTLRPQASEISELFWLPAEQVERELNFPEWRAAWHQILSYISQN